MNAVLTFLFEEWVGLGVLTVVALLCLLGPWLLGTSVWVLAWFCEAVVFMAKLPGKYRWPEGSK